ncbi:GntR family transcriptional regulator [Streptomyces sp. NPDC096193]|uniref:GntR family transcriptional regulator n=1 Tax=Streptomyces sp. NPDC096193 TaxID=3155821 RepID=UPI00331ECDFE
MSEIQENPAERIAGDLALAIHQGLIRGGERMPSQKELMAAYGVAMGTAAAALAKVRAAGLSRSETGRGTYAVDANSALPRPVMEVMAAASLCRQLSATSFGPGTAAPTLDLGPSPREDGMAGDREAAPVRQVDVSALVGLDRQVLRWMSEALLVSARRMVAAGHSAVDEQLLAAARALLRDGGRRPEGQPAITQHGGCLPAVEDVAARIWPERTRPAGSNWPPF